ncbi:hypothetical protein [Phytomonospora endophytica]|uniref:Uncharacterized protein n=1 Tax=Phytomonospora endophytica TaxID=714109 RepID=A0A841FGI2_9ACTN|nr:hypothetical protein [Phytomonospora endophytica]MBB6032197.1 hypothetical protein [Phytomonospora endophytica]GIG68546.1 hypothetical protein Pen01_48410 [Phytomonospora endophytica]
MGTITELGQAVRTATAELPLGGTAQAAARLDEARGILAQALTESVEPAGLPEISRAQTHLDRAITQLIAAAEHLDDYLVSIGLAPGGDKGEIDVPASAPAAPAPDGRRSWWLTRIAEITKADEGQAKAAEEIRHTELTPLFEKLVKIAAGGDRDLFRRELQATDPAVGIRLPALTWPQIRVLATEFLGETPTAKNLDRLRAKTGDRIRQFLPGLDDKAGEIELAAACHVAQPPERHPVDIAAMGPVLVAALIRARGKQD